MSKTRRTGSIIQRNKISWQVSLYLGENANGKRKYHSKTIRGTKKDAQQYLNKILHERDSGVFVESPKLSLNEYLNNWIEAALCSRVSVRTADGYAGILNRYIREPLGHKKLEKIGALDIQKVYGEMLARGLSSRSVKHTHAVLNNALKQAVKWGLLGRNPAEFVELPKDVRTERRVLSAEEAQRFIAASEEITHGLIFEFALLTGMRPEEYLALQWKDVDFERGTAQVQRALVRHKKAWGFEETKTQRSRRTVMLPKSLVQKLKLHKRQQNEARLRAGSQWQAHDLVFCSETGTPHSIPNLTYRYFRPILQKADLPQIRLYDLRHSHATLLLAADENPKIVAERLGHSTVVLTLDTYSHVLPTMQQKTTDKLEAMLYNVG